MKRRLSLESINSANRDLPTSYLEAGVRPWMAKVVESPWFRWGVHGFSVEVRGHAISCRKLEQAHGDWTLLPGDGETQKEG